MISVGIITFHYINNHGALLQAYALKKYIEKIGGYQSEIINYIPRGFEYDPYEVGSLGKKKMECKMNHFQDFLIKNCGIQSNVVTELPREKYDIYCVGSDQVWNFDISNGDKTYFLEGIGDFTKKISYASSIGLSIEKLSPYKMIFKKYLEKFNYVSVREKEHEKWLTDVCGISCTTVLDPTFLLDLEDYNDIISRIPLRDHAFILLLWYPHDDQLVKVIEFANNVSRKFGLPIVHNILNVRPYILNQDDGYMFYEGIENFLWYIKNASVIITNSYHTMLFSIHFKRPFYAFIVENMQSRFDTLGKNIGIQDRFVTSYIEPNDISLKMNYKNVYERIEPYRKRSKDYLKLALGCRNGEMDE